MKRIAAEALFLLRKMGNPLGCDKPSDQAAKRIQADDNLKNDE